MNKKLQHVQRTISLTTGNAQMEAVFSDIHGPVVACASTVIGNLPTGTSADLSIFNGATEVLRPIDLSVPETTTKNSFHGLLYPLTIENPGQIKAQITASAPLGAGESYKVKVLIWYAVEKTSYDCPTIKDCI